jgi:DNA-binding response OmpR family regulator
MSAGRTGTILVVDDHADSLSALAMLLTREGYTVHVASGVREASAVAATGGCDLLLADLALPDGRGTELMRELKLTRGTRGIAISGHTDEPTKREAADAGFEQFIEKPAVYTRLLSAVRDVMSRHAAPVCNGVAPAEAAPAHASPAPAHSH